MINNDMIGKDEMFSRFQKLMESSKEKDAKIKPLFEDNRLVNAFKEPETDEEGYSEPLPTVWNNYGYGEFHANGMLFVTKRSASTASKLYSRFLDEKAILYDFANDRLLMYIPDQNEPRMAFKGSAWQIAVKLSPDQKGIVTLEEIYQELAGKLKALGE